MGDMPGRISTDTVAVTTTSTHHSVCDYILDNDDDDIQNNLKVLVKNGRVLLNNSDVSLIGEQLSKQRIPHNMNIRVDLSLRKANQWKATHGRQFVLYTGLAILINILSKSHLFHFAVYVVAIKLLHAPENGEEINLVEKLLKFYWESSPLIYASAVELYSLHSHLHLADQVRHHDGLSYSSAYAFESCIRYTKRKRMTLEI
ncbi:unnamed protein product [Rotaria socialis]|uniref:Uncharacterized protein n=1 Tax=Rotaria socialis TaxID=392032 RepID=A0A821IBC8_9BILA|nr:unnamed protein product [Rotaria socialis]